MTAVATNRSPHIPLMNPGLAPDWADVFGEDDFGVFTEFSLKATRFVWRWIPPGRFLMGSPDNETGRWTDEGPQHEVTISRGFWLGETPVTQAQWRAVMENNPSQFPEDQRPVDSVSWHQSLEFSQRLNALFPALAASLPTEAQWEYACRAGTAGAFHDGSACTVPEGLDPALDQLGWFGSNSGAKTHPVKGKLPNDWGLYDMHGNVWEWCLDAWNASEYQSRINDVVDPVHVDEDSSAFRVLRGGSWYSQAQYCRAAYRLGYAPGNDWDFTGLRLSAGQGQFGKVAEPVGAERPEVPPRRSRG